MTPTEKKRQLLQSTVLCFSSQVASAQRRTRTKRGIVARHLVYFGENFEAVSAASKGEISLMAMKYSRTFGCCQNDMTPWGSHKGGFKEICGRFGLGGHVNPISGTRCHSLRVLPVRGKIVRSYDKRERSAFGYHARKFFLPPKTDKTEN